MIKLKHFIFINLFIDKEKVKRWYNTLSKYDHNSVMWSRHNCEKITDKHNYEYYSIVLPIFYDDYSLNRFELDLLERSFGFPIRKHKNYRGV